MNYHNITTDDMLNGDGLRVVFWVAGCNHHCRNCQNPITWDPNGGLEFDTDALTELTNKLNHDYISGITFSGGDPLHPENRETIKAISAHIKFFYPDKTQWLYTGYTFEEIVDENLLDFIKNIDILVDGPFIPELADVNYKWAGSTNQRIWKRGENGLWQVTV